MKEIFSLGLWLAAFGQLGLLLVSAQVPHQLGWRTDLKSLRPFNRKLFWTYSGYVVFTYLAFVVLTATLHGEMLRGDKAAVEIAVFIGLYWLIRLGLDVVVFSAADWPQGLRFRLGHIVLNIGFCCFAATYLGLAVWQATN